MDKVVHNILLIGPDYQHPRGGIGSVLALYKEYMPEAKFASTYDGSKSGLYNNMAFIWSLAKLLRKMMGDKSIRLVHIHGASNGSFYRKYMVFLCARAMGKKTIYHIHGGGFYDFYRNAKSPIRRMVTNFINHADCVICLSESWRSVYETAFRPKRLEVIPNFVLLPVAQPKPQGKVVFLFLGKIMTAKGIYDLIEVATSLRDKHPGEFELWIGGDGEKEKLQSLIKRYNMSDCVQFLGWVSDERKEEVLNLAHVYVLPSYKEAMPISILEAMAHHMPVIASRVGGIPEVVADGVSGYMIEPGDKTTLYNLMDRFMSHRDTIDTMGEASRTIVQEKFSPTVVLTKLATIYKDLLGVKNEPI